MEIPQDFDEQLTQLIKSHSDKQTYQRLPIKPSLFQEITLVNREAPNLSGHEGHMLNNIQPIINKPLIQSNLSPEIQEELEKSLTTRYWRKVIDSHVDNSRQVRGMKNSLSQQMSALNLNQQNDIPQIEIDNNANTFSKIWYQIILASSQIKEIQNSPNQEEQEYIDNM